MNNCVLWICFSNISLKNLLFTDFDRVIFVQNGVLIYSIHHVPKDLLVLHEELCAIE